jgi:hypothetical protein
VLDNHGLRRAGATTVPFEADLVLYGRDLERSAINALLDGARAARGGVLVLRGRAGAGKSALLDDAVAAEGVRVLRATGVESEFELPFAALHQLLRPVLSDVDRLPAPQASALRMAFGLASNGKNNRFLVSVAVLGITTPSGSTMRRHPLLSLWPAGSTLTGSLCSSPPATVTYADFPRLGCPNCTSTVWMPKRVDNCWPSVSVPRFRQR